MYEASEIVAIGAAHQLILGAKPELFHLDAEGSAGYDERQMDIDETDVWTLKAEFARAFRTDRNTRSEKGCLNHVRSIRDSRDR